MTDPKRNIDPESARGGMMTPNMRLVLGASIVAAIVAMVLIFFVF